MSSSSTKRWVGKALVEPGKQRLRGIKKEKKERVGATTLQVWVKCSGFWIRFRSGSQIRLNRKVWFWSSRSKVRTSDR